MISSFSLSCCFAVPLFYSTVMIAPSSALLAVLVTGKIISPVAAELAADQLEFAPTTALPGKNIDDGSVATNFIETYNKEQLFLIAPLNMVFEKPATAMVQYVVLYWCSDLTFSKFLNSSTSMAYAGRCVAFPLTGLADTLAAGGQGLYSGFLYGSSSSEVRSISASYVEQLNVFEGQIHDNNDNWVYRYWDDGRSTMPSIQYETHDAGDLTANSATSAWSSFAEITWTSTEDAAKILNMTTSELTPKAFKDVYATSWITQHEAEAANANLNSEAELEIVNEVKEEIEAMNTNDGSTNEGSTSNPTNTNVGTTDTDVNSDPVDSGTGRNLASVTTRIASAALRMFGI